MRHTSVDTRLVRSSLLSRAKRFAAACAGVAALAACVSACSSSPVKPRPTKRYDAGSLVIVPQTARQTAVSLADAKFDFAHTEEVGHDSRVQKTIFGLVTVDPAIARPTGTHAAPIAPQQRLSWVFFFTAGKSNCGSQPVAGSPAPTPSGSRSNALIVDSATGTALHYTGSGGENCTYNAKPVLESAFQAVSLPWIDLGGNRIRATYPGCVQPGAGTPTTSGPSGWVIEVLGERAIAPCHEPATTSVLTINFPRPGKHGPVGPVRSGYADL